MSDKLKTINIKGKQYVEVQERVKAFRERFNMFTLETEMLSNTDGVCVFKATVKDDQGRVLATGHAQEKEADKSSFVNATSYIENCETSAVGRALGLLGIGIDTSIASYEEVQTAVNIQNSKKEVKTLDEKTFRQFLQAVSAGKKTLDDLEAGGYKLTDKQYDEYSDLLALQEDGVVQS